MSIHADAIEQISYDSPFKRLAVEYWRLSATPTIHFAESLGIDAQELDQWIQEFDAIPANEIAQVIRALQTQTHRLKCNVPQSPIQVESPSEGLMCQCSGLSMNPGSCHTTSAAARNRLDHPLGSCPVEFDPTCALVSAHSPSPALRTTHISFQEVVCKKLHCAPGAYVEMVFSHCLYPHSKWLSYLIHNLYPSHFAMDFELIEEVASFTKLETLRARVEAHRYHHPPVSSLPRFLRVRISGWRLICLAGQVLD
jgi:hypothetical protein